MLEYKQKQRKDEIMATGYVIAIIVSILFIAFTCYACCVAAGRSDELDRKMHQDWLAAHDEKNEEK